MQTFKKLMIKYVETIFYVITGYNVWKQAAGSFIFSLRNKENLPPFKAPLKDQNDGQAIYGGSNYGPAFGGGHDLLIFGNATANILSYTKLGTTYQAPSGVSDRFTILAGTYYFSPSEVEVFHLV